jgi:biotin operon repressor
MVDRYQVVLSIVAVAIMVAVPVLCVLLYDLLAGRWDESLARVRRALGTSREHRRNLRRLRRQQGVPIEQVAANLRRLRIVVACDANRSAAHQMGNRLAYDRVLAQACEMLDVVHDLDKSSCGFERDIERFRLEAELERAGVVISARRFGQAA